MAVRFFLYHNLVKWTEGVNTRLATRAIYVGVTSKAKSGPITPKTYNFMIISLLIKKRAYHLIIVIIMMYVNWKVYWIETKKKKIVDYVDSESGWNHRRKKFLSVLLIFIVKQNEIYKVWERDCTYKKCIKSTLIFILKLPIERLREWKSCLW